MLNINKSEVKRVLNIQFEPYGDVLLSTSYLEALKDYFPNVKIDYLVSKKYAEILKNNPFISEVIAVPNKGGLSYFTGRLKAIWHIRKKKYDIIIDPQGNPGSAQVIIFSGAKYKLGWTNRRWGFVYNYTTEEKNYRYHASLRFDLLSPLGIKEQPYKLFYFIKKDSLAYIDNWLNSTSLKDEKIICISPAGPKESRNWDPDCYARFADIVLERTKYKVVFIWAPDELEYVKMIISKMKHEPVLAPPTTFNQAAAFLKRSFILVCNNGGMLHLSVATETPSLSIFRHSSITVWSPQDVFPLHYHVHNPHWEPGPERTFGVEPEVVFEKFQALTKEIP